MSSFVSDPATARRAVKKLRRLRWQRGIGVSGCRRIGVGLGKIAKFLTQMGACRPKRAIKKHQVGRDELRLVLNRGARTKRSSSLPAISNVSYSDGACRKAGCVFLGNLKVPFS
jgi:hypothetical protein